MEERSLEMGEQVKAMNLLTGTAIVDLERVVHAAHIKPRRENAVGIVGKGIPGVRADAVLVHHMDEDGLGAFNGETAAYYTCELTHA